MGNVGTIVLRLTAFSENHDISASCVLVLFLHVSRKPSFITLLIKYLFNGAIGFTWCRGPCALRPCCKRGQRSG